MTNLIGGLKYINIIDFQKDYIHKLIILIYFKPPILQIQKCITNANMINILQFKSYIILLQ